MFLALDLPMVWTYYHIDKKIVSSLSSGPLDQDILAYLVSGYPGTSLPQLLI